MTAAIVVAVLSAMQASPNEVRERLQWLARHQHPDGAWGPRGDCDCFGRAPPIECDPDVGRHVARLLARLGSDDIETRERAMSDVEALGVPALPFLEEARSRGDTEVRIRTGLLAAKLRPRSGVADPEVTALALLAFSGAGYSHLSKDVFERVVWGDLVGRGMDWLETRRVASPLAAGASMLLTRGKRDAAAVDQLVALDAAKADDLTLFANTLAVMQADGSDGGRWAVWNFKVRHALKGRDGLECGRGRAGHGRAVILHALAYQVCLRYANTLAGSRR